MSRQILIWGAGGHARVLNEFLPVIGYEVVAVIDDDPEAMSPLPGVPIAHGWEGFRRWRDEHADADVCGVVAFGQEQLGPKRLEVQERLEAAGIAVPCMQHPAAYVAANVRIHAGAQVLAHATVGAEARVGRACIVNSAASVDHECVLGDGAHVAPGAVLTGNVQVGSGAFVGAGAVVLPGRTIGRRAVIGAGAVVTADVPENVVAYGNPARVVDGCRS